MSPKKEIRTFLIPDQIREETMKVLLENHSDLIGYEIIDACAEKFYESFSRYSGIDLTVLSVYAASLLIDSNLNDEVLSGKVTPAIQKIGHKIHDDLCYTSKMMFNTAYAEILNLSLGLLGAVGNSERFEDPELQKYVLRRFSRLSRLGEESIEAILKMQYYLAMKNTRVAAREFSKVSAHSTPPEIYGHLKIRMLLADRDPSAHSEMKIHFSAQYSNVSSENLCGALETFDSIFADEDDPFMLSGDLLATAVAIAY